MLHIVKLLSVSVPLDSMKLELLTVGSACMIHVLRKQHFKQIVLISLTILTPPLALLTVVLIY